MHDVALLHQQLFCLGTYCFDDGVGEEFFAVEAGDAFVEVDTGYISYSEGGVILDVGEEHTGKARHLEDWYSRRGGKTSVYDNTANAGLKLESQMDTSIVGSERDAASERRQTKRLQYRCDVL